MNPKIIKKLKSIPSSYKTNSKIICIGDIHGDLLATIQCLRKVKLINKNGNWIGGNKYVVQIGDVVDRGGRDFSHDDEASELKIMNLFNKLDYQAKKVGGRVFCLLGNHEIMNTMGIFDYVSPNGLKAFGGRIGRKRMFAPGGQMSQMMGLSRFAILKINDVLFVHGGINNYISNNYTLNQINYLMRLYLMGQGSLINNKEFQKLFINGDSLLWNRKYSTTKMTRSQCIGLSKMLRRYNANILTIGHSPQEQGINSDCNGKVWRIDTGVSEAFGQRSASEQRIQVLEIVQLQKNKKRFIIHK